MTGDQSRGIKEQLAACEPTPASHSLGLAFLFLRWGGRGFHFNRFFDFRDTNRQDANSAAPDGQNQSQGPGGRQERRGGWGEVDHDRWRWSKGLNRRWRTGGEC